jgi:hypothetical protein
LIVDQTDQIAEGLFMWFLEMSQALPGAVQ